LLVLVGCWDLLQTSSLKAGLLSPQLFMQYSLLCIIYIKDLMSISGHVIPPDQLLPVALARGPSGLQLDFTYQSRATRETVIMYLCQIIATV